MLRDGTTGDWIGSLAGHKGAVWSAKLDPTANLAATASGDYSVKVWDAVTGAELYHFPHEHIAKSCDFSPDSRSLATGGKEGVLRVYDLAADGGDPSRLQSPRKIPHLDAAGKKVAINKVVWKSDSCLITGGDDGKIRIWTLPRGAGAGPATEWPASPSHVLSTDDGAEIRDAEYVATARGEEILTVAAGSKVYFFDLKSRERLRAHAMPIHFRDEGGASLHPSEAKFVAGGSDLWVRVFDYETGKELECLKGHHGPIRCLRYAPDGKSFASGSEDGTIRLWKSSEQQ
jgi:serine-threonine kinase receptor-associated protein